MHSSLYFVIPNFNSFYSGGNLYNKELVNGLQQIGIEVKVLNAAQFKKHTIDNKGHYFFDTLFLSTFFSFFTKKNHSAKYYLIVHHLESLYPPTRKEGHFLFVEKEYPILKHFHGFLTSSPFTANYLAKNGLAQPKIVILPALTLPIQNIPERASTPINALLIANLVERKGILPFLEKLNNNSISLSPKQLQIQLIGSFDMEANYANKCLNLINNSAYLSSIVNCLGALESNKIIPYYQNANLFISCSYMETYGMALQEAVAYKLPIIAIDKGNTKNHIQEGINGFLFENFNALVAKLYYFINHPSALAQLQRSIWLQPASRPYDWTIAANNFLSQLR